MKKLEKSGAVKLEFNSSADDAALDVFYNMEMAGWKGREGSAVACDQNTKRFYTLAAKAAAKYGYFAMSMLKCGEEPVAVNYSMSMDGFHFIPKTTFSEKFSQSSPGQLIMREVLRDCLAKGYTEFDFLGPFAPWKGHWANKLRVHHHCFIYRNNLKGQMLHFIRFQLARRARAYKHKWQEMKAKKAAAAAKPVT